MSHWEMDSRFASRRDADDRLRVLPDLAPNYKARCVRGRDPMPWIIQIRKVRYG